ncbi:EI24 domain-containing protein [Sulfitobacter guttiformis]|uniref:Uncharacterized protein involved in cysteine biosynthesis n=1 Tax=Sulfitobacter guttiformis TaxID=74349 RepID=A0A420DT96_9RHOB|nr:EI24 domain-containing protein [Sulfitobacter guttiformis]KIN74821.1 Membrane protein [Sulfitobacter guttiformis KCTC 32187]RKE97393.1 uncharacterized protein involved in cysteine biosynthesis [Sulfitobacter guttiformis]
MALNTVFTAFGLALGQLGDPRFRRVLLLGIGGALAVLAAFTWGLAALAEWFAGDAVTLPLVGEVRWLDTAFGWGAVVLGMALSVFLMVPVASAITSLFLDDVADAVESVHYPHIPQAPRTPFMEAMRDTLGFLAVIVAVNLCALILYLVFAPVAIFIFWAVNGFLLGREYFMLVAMRRVGRVRAKELRRKHFLTVWLAGILMAMPLSIPLVNLAIPILGAATFTHLYQLLTTASRVPSSSPDHSR